MYFWYEKFENDAFESDKFMLCVEDKHVMNQTHHFQTRHTKKYAANY